VTERLWHLLSIRSFADREGLALGPQSENNSGRERLLNAGVEDLGGRVLREAEDVATPRCGSADRPG
jgi:hypothetical protein